MTEPLRPTLFAAALAPMVVAQIIRLHQTTASGWLAWDVAGRLGTILVIGWLPATRGMLFQREKRRIPLWETALWIFGIVLVALMLLSPTVRFMGQIFPASIIGYHPRPHGLLFLFDMTIGIALVAYHEELIFRRLGLAMLGSRLGTAGVVLVSALLFGLYHWSTSVGNAASATIIGIPFMMFYLRAGALWPPMLAHYLVDVLIEGF